jgi:lipopolysaccharide exporter
MRIKQLASSEYLKNIFTLVAGSALAQAINFAFNIYLARIYSPSSFGELSIFISIAAFILVFSCGRYDVALVSGKTDKQAYTLFTICFYLVSAIALLSFPVIGFLYLCSINFYQNTAVYHWFYYLPPFVFLVTGIQIINMWFIRQKKFRSISFVRIIETLTIGISSILLKNFYGLGLLLANLLSQLSSFVILSWLLLKEEKITSFICSKKELKKTAVDYIEFPKINILQGFVDMLQLNGIPLIMAGYIGEGKIGLYALCIRVLQAPVYLIVKPITTVFFADASEKNRKGEEIYSLTKKTIRHTAFISVALPLVLLMFGPSLFALVFGEQWREAGEYASLFSIWYFFDLIRQSISQLTSVLGTQKKLLLYSLSGIFLLLATIFIGEYAQMEVKTIFILITLVQSITSISITAACLLMAKKTS